jgi:hypothetical protein
MIKYSKKDIWVHKQPKNPHGIESSKCLDVQGDLRRRSIHLTNCWDKYKRHAEAQT